jgi:twitching motility two-component system response regulator PilH
MALLDRLKGLFGATRANTPRPAADAPMPRAPVPEAAGDATFDAPLDAPLPAPTYAGGIERRANERPATRPGLRMLLIDDSSTILALLGRMLRQNGFEIADAEDAEAGLTLAFATPPDLIFLDIVLPGMNGFAALRALRRDERTRHVPIIMISGNEQATEEFYLYRIGADDFMKKPFSRAEVFARIERLLDAEGVPRRIGTMAMNEKADATVPVA